ncbi:ATP-binding protein [Nonomuraea sp. NPDC049129]|uniref:ATP-binding protein n=1 Tax=Nonomuraea sp. NPDC049129 TaxID=3155272 RepID=UPI003405D358
MARLPVFQANNSPCDTRILEIACYNGTEIRASQVISMPMRAEDVILIGATRLRRGRMAPKQARAAVAWWLADDHPTVPDVQQVVSELVTNACEHVEGGPDREWVTVSVGRGNGFFRVEVTDPGAFGAEPHMAEPAPEAESGRGIRIVADLSNGCWGTFVTAVDHRIVWANVKFRTVRPNAESTCLEAHHSATT